MHNIIIILTIVIILMHYLLAHSCIVAYTIANHDVMAIVQSRQWTRCPH